MIGLAAIPLAVTPSHLSWHRWQVATYACAWIAVFALIVQACIQSKEDHEREGREKGRDQAIASLTKSFDEWRQTPRLAIAAALPEPKIAKQEPDTIFDGEIQRLFFNPRTGMASYEMLAQMCAISGRKDPPKVDCDLLVSMYVVNISSSVRYIRDIRASVEIDGKRVSLKRINNFRVKIGDSKDDPRLEYGFHADSDSHSAAPLKPLVPSDFPYDLGPREPSEGWIRFFVDDVVPPQLDSNTLEFTLVDSDGNRHPITKVSVSPKSGQVGYRYAH